jgi:hypothetical protein
MKSTKFYKLTNIANNSYIVNHTKKDLADALNRFNTNEKLRKIEWAIYRDPGDKVIELIEEFQYDNREDLIKRFKQIRSNQEPNKPDCRNAMHYCELCDQIVESKNNHENTPKHKSKINKIEKDRKVKCVSCRTLREPTDYENQKTCIYCIAKHRQYYITHFCEHGRSESRCKLCDS